jgi:Carboxypeptidase regulatory-like domain/TonB dependent receptor
LRNARDTSSFLGGIVKNLLMCGLTLLFGSALAGAQISNNTSLVGTVSDATGAVVPGVHVTAVNQGTKYSFEAVTNAEGYYAISGQILPGTYDIRVEQSGFSKEQKIGAIVTLNQATRTDFVLRPGAATTEVTVSANTQTIQTDDSLLGETVTEQQIANLPMNGRNALDLANIASNVSIPTGSALTGIPPGKQASGAGTRGVNNAVTLDGISIQNNLSSTLTVQPNPDALGAVQTQNGNYTAQYGNYIGIHINMATKSGTNSFHGTVYDYIQNDALNSRGFNTSPTVPQKTALRYNLFGGVVGGPVLIPFLYNGRNKTFFLASYEGLRTHTAKHGFSQAFTPDEEAGDFSVLLNPTLSGLSKPNLIFSPIDGHAYYNPMTGRQVINDQPVANAPIVKNILSYAALANVAGAALPVNNLATTTSVLGDNSSLDRIDQVIGDKIRIFARYDWQSVTSSSVAREYVNSSYGPTTVRNAAAGLTYIITPNLVNDLRGGFDWLKTAALNYFYVNGPKNADSLLGIPAPFGNGQASGDPGLPDVQGGNSFSINERGNNWIQDDRTYQLYDQISWTKNRHTFMAGADIRRLKVGRAAVNSARGVLPFASSYTSFQTISAIPSSICPGGTSTTASSNCTYGSTDASLVTGIMSGDTTPLFQVKEDPTQWRNGFFALDTWQVSPKLTLEIGLRYELPMVPYSANGLGRTLDPTYSFLLPPSTASTPGTYVPQPGFKFTGPDHNDIGPRLGVAYRVTNRIVVRGGGGIYYNANQLNAYTLTSSNYPFAASVVYASPTPGAQTASNPYITLANPTAGAGASPVAGVPGTYVTAYSVANPLPSETMYQWNLDNGLELWRNAGIEFQYLGSHSIHLNTNYYPNEPIPHPVNTSTSTINSLRPNQNFGQIRVAANIASASYNGLTTVFRQRLTHGVSANISYTWAHALEEAPDAQQSGTCMNQLNCKADWGNADADIRNKIVVSFTYGLPTFANHNFLIQEAIGGWQVNGILTAQSGSPFNVSYGSFDWAYAEVPQVAASSAPQRPNYTHAGRMTCNKQSLLSQSYAVRNQVSCVDQSAYSLNPRFTYGNLHRNDMHGPGAFSNNLSLFKNFKIHESTEFQFRLEAFNAFNHANLGTPGNITFNVTPTCNTSACAGTAPYFTGTMTPTSSSASFGYPTVGTNGRTVQIAGKINF